MDRKRGFFVCIPALSLLYLLLSPLPVCLPGFSLVSYASADTIPGGNVSGTWYASSSPYYITGNITIPAGSALTIEPGVMVDFLGIYSFTVNGWLEAVGTEADSIWFAGGWWGFYFNGAPGSSSMEYCSISGALRGIKTLGSSSPGISHCRFSNNSNGICWESTSDATISDCVISDNTEWGGVDMNWSQGNLTMVDCVICDNVSSYQGAGVRISNGTVNSFAGCTISGNWSEQRGAGVSCHDSASVAFTDCTISDNYSNVQQGGGVALTNGSTATFTDCAINGNTGFNMVPPYDNGGGGISLVDASATLSHCTVFDNYTIEYGAGIAVTNGNLVLDHCTISGNQSSDDKSGISIAGSGSTSDITNSIISYNNFPGSQPSYGIYNQGSLMVEYSDFYGNEAGDILGNVPSGFGVLDRVNLNGDSCDCYYDIFMEPMFADTAGGDFHLLAGSPCIDAGDPTFPYDPDGTITDMGRYYFNQTGVGEGSSAVMPSGSCVLSCHPNPCREILNIHFEIPGQSPSSLSVYGLDGRLLVHMTDCLCGDTGDILLDVSGMCSGVYLCRLEAGSNTQTTAFLVMR